MIVAAATEKEGVFMKKRAFLVTVLLALALTGMTNFPKTEADAQNQPPLNVAFVWHQHQPFYKGPDSGIYLLPWVRMHAVKDYYDMAAMLTNYPGIRATFNLVPSLLLQLEEYAAGKAVDSYMLVAAKNAQDLTDADKDFLLRRFFDANWNNVIKRYPRYWELLQKRGTSGDDAEIARAISTFSVQDFRDLQLWFDLAWFDPDVQRDDPEIKKLMTKGQGFTEEDKLIVHDKQLRIIGNVIGIYKKLQESGVIEIITSPYYHPILPLLDNVENARIASPELELPSEGFHHPDDAVAQLQRAATYYQELFGCSPRGLWPSEQAVGNSVAAAAAQAGFSWMVSNEGILAKALGIRLRDGSDKVVRPDLLYQPYYVNAGSGRQTAIIFRDQHLSDKIGFTYSGMSAAAAAEDLVSYLHAVRDALGARAGSSLVTIALDGENAWEYYPNDGKDFFDAIYTKISEDAVLRTVTVSEYLDRHPPVEAIDNLHTGSWISDNLETWIGEGEENKAWNYLSKARDALTISTTVYGNDPSKKEALERAWESLYAAEGSDWFWWYGSDQTSANDVGFDMLFRAHLAGIYRLINDPVPDYLLVPIIPKQPARPVKSMTQLSTPEIDGRSAPGEWDASASYSASGVNLAGKGASAAGTARPVQIKDLNVAADNTALYLRVVMDEGGGADAGAGGGADAGAGSELPPGQLAVYFSNNRIIDGNVWTRFAGDAGAAGVSLGITLNYEALINFSELNSGTGRIVLSRAESDVIWTKVREVSSVSYQDCLEMRIPFEALEYQSGDDVYFTVVLADEQSGSVTSLAPSGGPVHVKVPQITAGKLVMTMTDPIGDDIGPGSYTYPTNALFTPGVFDLVKTEIYDDQDDLTFKIYIYGELNNLWDSPIGLSLQTIDLYFDVDGVPNSGEIKALGGRRAVFDSGAAWEYAVWVEGWHQKIFAADGSEVKAAVRVSTDPITKSISISVPKQAIGYAGGRLGFMVLIMGQEGFPSGDSLRVREVMEQAAEWRFGGGTQGSYDPNIIDMLVPEGTRQEAILGAYDPAQARFATLPMIYIELP